MNVSVFVVLLIFRRSFNFLSSFQFFVVLSIFCRSFNFLSFFQFFVIFALFVVVLVFCPSSCHEIFEKAENV